MAQFIFADLIKRRHVDLKVVTDERICDGYYYAVFFKHYRNILRRPEQLDTVPTEIINDID